MNENGYQQILFLCTGNYYRSRFAEHLFNALAAQQGILWYAESKGLAADWGIGNMGPISRHAVEGLMMRGVTLPSNIRFPEQVTDADLAAADKVVALDVTEHRPLLERRFPDWVDRVDYWKVHDLGFTDPDRALAQIETGVWALLATLGNGHQK